MTDLSGSAASKSPIEMTFVHHFAVISRPLESLWPAGGGTASWKEGGKSKLVSQFARILIRGGDFLAQHRAVSWQNE